jgi:hypothetical protein
MRALRKRRLGEWKNLGPRSIHGSHGIFQLVSFVPYYDGHTADSVDEEAVNRQRAR